MNRHRIRTNGSFYVVERRGWRTLWRWVPTRLNEDSTPRTHETLEAAFAEVDRLERLLALDAWVTVFPLPPSGAHDGPGRPVDYSTQVPIWLGPPPPRTDMGAIVDAEIERLDAQMKELMASGYGFAPDDDRWDRAVLEMGVLRRLKDAAEPGE